MIKQYNQIDPSFAERIFTMAEQEQKHVHNMREKQFKFTLRIVLFGTISGLLALTSLCYLLYLSIEKGSTTTSVSITAIIAAVVSIFVLRKRSNKD